MKVAEPRLIFHDTVWTWTRGKIERLPLGGKVETYPTTIKGREKLALSTYILPAGKNELVVGGPMGFDLLKLKAEKQPLR